MSALDELKQLLEEWAERFDGDDFHSIQRQLNGLAWWSAFYRSLNASRQLLPETADGGKLANGTLHELINEGYFSMQAAGVRRLVDEDKATGLRGVNSLWRLISDIRPHTGLLTRESMLAARDLPYDYASRKREAHRAAMEETIREAKPGTYVSTEGWASSEMWHGTWDELCRVNADMRTPLDRPQDTVFQQWLDFLKRETEDVVAYVHKHIAHAATKTSRNSLTVDQVGLSLDKLWRGERALTCAASFVSRCFCSGAELGGVPIPQFDVFENLDQPFVVDGTGRVMQAAWDEHSRYLERCRGWHGGVGYPAGGDA